MTVANDQRPPTNLALGVKFVADQDAAVGGASLDSPLTIGGQQLTALGPPIGTADPEAGRPDPRTVMKPDMTDRVAGPSARDAGPERDARTDGKCIGLADEALADDVDAHSGVQHRHTPVGGPRRRRRSSFCGR